ncbi:MAG TPA: molybdopterin-dependent oxidoreductase [Acidimicrobiales bacterium]
MTATDPAGTDRRITYCRICAATCGLVVDVIDNRVVRAVGDVDNPLTRGFSCPKGRHIGEFLAAPDRHRTSLRRAPDGTQEPIDATVAIEEIAARLIDIMAEHGPDAVGFLSGTQSAFSSLTSPFANAWWATMGSAKAFSTMTIDQSAMWVADGRLGQWAGGRQRFEDADVWLLAGSNPPVSLQGGEFTGFPIHDPVRRLVDAKRRGLRLIVIDPRRTETAAHADLHLQLVPGTDVFLYAGLLHVLFRDGHVDRGFTDRWVTGLPELRRAVEPFRPEVVAELCGLDAEDVVEAATIFGTATSGMAMTGTGPDMGPWSNLAEHLARCLNVVCGRYPSEGEASAGVNVLGSAKSPPAQVIPPDRTWERGYRSRFGFGLLKRELPTASLPDEILEPGPDRIRALVVSGGNPATAIPDRDRAVQALRSLDLLVTVDPFPTETARLAHYVVAPVMHLERPDTTRSYEGLFEEPFAQYTPAVVEAPPGTVDDWEFFLRLAWAMGRTIQVAGREYPPGSPLPTTDEVLASFCTRGRVPLDELARHPHGTLVPEAGPPIVGPALTGPGRPEPTHRFDVLPADVAAELLDAREAAASDIARRPYRLIVRRTKETINSLGRRIPGLPRHTYNPCAMHPDDLAALGLEPGDTVVVESDHGRAGAVVDADATLRRGVVSMSHAFGGLPGEDDDPTLHGTNPTRLLSIDAETQSINRMPRMSAIPVTIVAAPAGTGQPAPA